MGNDGLRLSPGLGRRPPELLEAFSLLELLVVIALICLLLSVLLPSMSKAREQGKIAACMANLKDLAVAGAAYQTEHQGYIAGSPVTSGFPLAVKDLGNGGQWRPGMALNIFDYAVPLMKQMNIVLPQTPDARVYYPLTTEGAFHCPSNRQVAVSWPVDNGVVIRAPSYLTMNTLMRAGPEAYEFWRRPENKMRLAVSSVKSATGAVFTEAAEYKDLALSDKWDIVVPRAYVPRLERVGCAALKVFLADGLRFYRPPNTIDYNIHTTGFAGDLSAQPPSDISGTKEAAREYNLARKFSYRHRGGKSINAAMFDGHVESLRVEFTSFHWQGYAKRGTGSALHPKHYFPSRSRVRDNTNLLLQAEVPVGTALP
jgi:prepilin-type processing-associated H-X9-DG protein